jgi:hypothetical protein
MSLLNARLPRLWRTNGPGRLGDAPYPRRLERRSTPRPPLHFRRIELKYFLPERTIPQFLEAIAPYTEIDPYLVQEGRGRTAYPVTSLYFDSWDLSSFFEKEGGLLFRRKIRLRAYEERLEPNVACFLEIKRRLDSVVLKDRLALPPGVLASLPDTGLLRYLLSKAESRERTAIEAELMAHWFNLQPTSLIRYERLARVGRDERTTRVTVDRNLEASWRPVGFMGNVPLRSAANVHGTGTMGISGRYGLLELKCNNTVPGWFHRAVQNLELSRTAFSKYYLTGTCIRPILHEDCTSGGRR